jgi:hypothetical protein
VLRGVPAPAKYTGGVQSTVLTLIPLRVATSFATSRAESLVARAAGGIGVFQGDEGAYQRGAARPEGAGESAREPAKP